MSRIFQTNVRQSNHLFTTQSISIQNGGIDRGPRMRYTFPMPRYPWSRTTPRRPRKLTWYLVITQLFTLLGRLIGHAASGTATAGAPRRRTSSRTTSSRTTTARRR